MEKFFFANSCKTRCKNAFKLNSFNEDVITRESNCGHFRPSGLAWRGIWDRFLKKMLKSCCFCKTKKTSFWGPRALPLSFLGRKYQCDSNRPTPRSTMLHSSLSPKSLELRHGPEPWLNLNRFDGLTGQIVSHCTCSHL